MEGSTILGWMASGFAALAAGTLIRAHFRPEADGSHLLTEATTAIALVVTLGPLPRLLRLDNDVLKWSLAAIETALLLFAFVQLHRFRRLKQSDSHAQR